MAEYIEREALKRLLIDKYNFFPVFVKNAIEESPTADVVEVRHGKWISASKKQGVNIGMKCSLCGARIKYSEFFNGNHNYCHKCGAKMDGKEEVK